MTRPKTLLGQALRKAGLVRIEPPLPQPTVSRGVQRRPGRRPAATPPAPPTRDYFRDELPLPPEVPPFEPRLRPAHTVPSATSHRHEPPQRVPPPNDGPPKYTGEMVWLHKTAPVLEIHGKKSTLTPADYAAGRRR